MAINAPLGYKYPAAERPILDCSVWRNFIFGVGVNCLFSFSGYTRASSKKISKDNGSTLFLLD